MERFTINLWYLPEFTLLCSFVKQTVPENPHLGEYRGFTALIIFSDICLFDRNISFQREFSDLVHPFFHAEDYIGNSQLFIYLNTILFTSRFGIKIEIVILNLKSTARFAFELSFAKISNLTIKMESPKV